MRISDWSSDVCSSDLRPVRVPERAGVAHALGIAELGAVREDGDARVLRMPELADGVRHDLAEAGTEGAVGGGRQVLAAKGQYFMVQIGPMDRRPGRVVQLAAEIDAVDRGDEGLPQSLY